MKDDERTDHDRLEEQVAKLTRDLERKNEACSEALESSSAALEEAAETVHDREARLRSILDTAIDGIITIDEFGIVETFNRAAERIFGYAADEVLGRNVRMLMPEPYHSQHEVYLARFMRTGKRQILDARREVIGRRKDGSTFPMELGVGEIMDHHRCFTGMVRDISDRKRLQAQVRYQASLVDMVSDAIISTDRDGTIRSWSRGAEKMYGWTAEDVLGLGREPELLQTVFPRTTRAAVMAGLAATGEAQCEVIQVTKDGARIDVLTSMTAKTDEAGAPSGFVALNRDITDRKRLERELQHALRMEAVGRLAGGIAHDINNLLMGISGCADLAIKRLDRRSPAMPFLDEVKRAALEGAAVPRRLLEFSRRRSRQTSVMDLDSVLESLEGMLARLLGEDIDIHFALGSDGGKIMGDPGQLEHVIVNLALNARDAMPHGGKLTIATAAIELAEDDPARPRALAPGPYITLTSADTGIGMDEETRSKAFDPFFTTKAHMEGTGLGLSTIYGFVQGSKGHIAVVSELGAGATFTIWLPVVDATLIRFTDTAPTKTAGHRTVLLVEDDARVRRAVASYLEPASHRVLQAEDGTSAIHLAGDHEGRIELLLIDAILPDIGGAHVAREVAALQPGIEIVFMSGHPLDRLEEDGLLPPRAVVLEKPFDEVALLAAIDRAFGVGEGSAA